jgi:hypothetical protein
MMPKWNLGAQIGIQKGTRRNGRKKKKKRRNGRIFVYSCHVYVTITKYHRMGNLKRTQIYFLTVL